MFSKPENTLRVGNLNMFYQKFNLRFSDEEKFLWKNRVQPQIEAINLTQPDILCIQELSPDAVTDLKQMLPDYGIYCVNTSNGIPSDLFTNDDWVGIMTAIAFRKDTFIPLKCGSFRTTDGSSNSNKRSVYLRLKHRILDHTFFVTSSHFTFRDDYCRIVSSQQLIDNADQLAEEEDEEFHLGDFNLFDDKDGPDAFNILTRKYDCFMREDVEHVGESDTFCGFEWDDFKHNIVDGHMEPRLCMSNIFYSLKKFIPIKSYVLPIHQYQDDEGNYKLKDFGADVDIDINNMSTDHMYIFTDIKLVDN